MLLYTENHSASYNTCNSANSSNRPSSFIIAFLVTNKFSSNHTSNARTYSSYSCSCASGKSSCSNTLTHYNKDSYSMQKNEKLFETYLQRHFQQQHFQQILEFRPRQIQQQLHQLKIQLLQELQWPPMELRVHLRLQDPTKYQLSSNYLVSLFQPCCDAKSVPDFTHFTQFQT